MLEWAVTAKQGARPVVRRAIKSLYAEGKTPSNGVGGKVEDLRIAPNP